MAIVQQGNVIVSSAQVNPGVIENSDVAAAAGIEGSKLQALLLGTNAGVLPSTGLVNAHVAVGSDIWLSKLSPQTQGDIVIATAGGVITPLVAGAAGEILQTNGAGNDPTWVAAPGVDVQEFAGSGTYTKPANAKMIFVELWGSGGGSGGVANNNDSPGAGGGGYRRHLFPAGDVGATETVTIGAAGTAGAAGNNAGGAGADCTFGSLLTGKGGAAGAAGQSQSSVVNGGAGGGEGNIWAGGVPKSGTPVKVDFGGGGGGATANGASNDGGSSVYGAGGGGSGDALNGDPGGTSDFEGGQGGNGGNNAVGGVGSVPGGGAGGSGSNGGGNRTGAVGAVGQCRVTTYI